MSRPHMRRIALFTFGFFLGACGEVEPTAVDAADQPDAAGADGAGSDAADPTDAGPDCVADTFDGSELDAHWGLTIGDLPTYSVDSSRLLITDSPLADTANPPVSWINELDTDKANQLSWAHAIGDGDFTVTADIGWSSSSPELTFGGVAVTNAQNMMSALVGVRDGSVTLNGQPTAQFLVRDAADVEYNGSREEPGSAIFRMQRRGGVLRAYIDDEEIGSDASPQDIAYVSVFYVRHRSAENTLYPFGSFEVREIQVCRP